MAWAWRDNLSLISSILGGRKITAMLTGDTLEGSLAKGCLQEGNQSPLQWGLVVDKLIKGLNENGCNILGYTNDTVVLSVKNTRWCWGVQTGLKEEE